MYNNFNKAASNDDYRYPTSFNDYTGNGLYDVDHEDVDEDDETISPVYRNDNYFI